MPCFHPIPAFKVGDGPPVFKGFVKPNMHVPCQQCIGCRLQRSVHWATRISHESLMHADNCFVTLTYAPGKEPDNWSLDHRDFQLFMKRLRKRLFGVPIRYYMCGEYGELNERPHFHICLFGYDFPDKVLFKVTPAGHRLFTSKVLDELWTDHDRSRGEPRGQLGFCTVGALTFESAQYTAKYILQKVTGANADGWYTHVNYETGEIFSRVPEYNRMSLKPGIGTRFLDKYKWEIYPEDFIVINGRKVAVPRFYDRKLSETEPDFISHVKEERLALSKIYEGDNTPARLRVKERVAVAKSNLFKRGV